MPFWRRRRDADQPPEPATPEVDPESVPADWEPDASDFEDAGDEVDPVEGTDAVETARPPGLGDLVLSWPVPAEPAAPPDPRLPTAQPADAAAAIESDEPLSDVTASERLDA